MADTYDVIICGAGSGGGFMAGQIAPNASVLILDAGPHFAEPPNPGTGVLSRRILSTQMSLGTWIPNSKASNHGSVFYSYPMYMDTSNPFTFTAQHEARVVGGGSAVNVGAWLRPRLVDWDGFEEETGVQDWTKVNFEPHFQRAERILNVHRDSRAYWNKASVLYEQAALSMGIPVVETASNRKNCIFCGHRLNAGMPCKYDSLMGTHMTQIPAALAAGATLIANATVTQINITNNTATGVTYTVNGQTFTANARKLVVVAAGAMGTPLILRDTGLHLINPNVGMYLRAHPGVPMDVLLPGTDWNQDRGYQWNCHHHGIDDNGNPTDAVAHLSAGFMATTMWVAAAFQIGLFGTPYKDVMRQWRQRAGAFIFEMKPAITGRVTGTRANPIILYPITDSTGVLEPKTMNDLLGAIRQVADVYQKIGAFSAFPNPSVPSQVLKQQISLFVTTSGALHPQGTCRAGSDPSNSVVDTNLMSWDIKNLMINDASVIPNALSSNPNSMIMAVSSRASDYVNQQILGATSAPTAQAEMVAFERARRAAAEEATAAREAAEREGASRQ
ncbi:MAG TPA: GMC family oxidoreductase [Bryobacteraceae bacterium]|nr:GMC family oxidoreductase [Bryobacteraceae bacterium]